MGRPWYFFGTVVAGGIVVVWSVQTVFWPDIPEALVTASYAVIIMSTAVGSRRLRERLLARDRVDESVGLDDDRAVAARAGSFGDLLLACLGLAGIFLMSHNTAAGLGCVGLVGVALISVEVRTALLRRRRFVDC